MVMKNFKAIYFIYNADGGIFNEIKYWIDKNILKRETACELCDISHGKIFMRSEWSKFIKELKKDYKVEVLHRNELPKKILDKGYDFPCVIGETKNDLIEIIDNITLSDFGKTDGLKELSQKLHMKAI
jgi:hypothetical protein|tara:strand:+ start:53 stop:436 length:384 start_codon:yes stop_codon:yes gene_type:complete